MNEETRIEIFKPGHGNGSLERHRRGDLFGPPGDLEFQKGLDLAACWGTIRKNRRLILTIFVVVTAIVATLTLLQKPTYRAQVLLEIEREAPNILTPQDLFTVDAVSDIYLETQYKVLENAALAEQVIGQLGLDHLAEFQSDSLVERVQGVIDQLVFDRLLGRKKASANPQMSATQDGIPEPPNGAHQKTLDRFRDRLEITPIRRSRLVEISFESQDPNLAARVVNAYASDYIEQNMQARWNASQKASGWLSRQLGDMKVKLQESEDKLQKYASGNDLLFLEGSSSGNNGGMYRESNESILTERVQRLQAELTKARAERNVKESLYRLVQSGDYESLPGVFENTVVQDLSVQLAQLKRQSAQLTTTYSPGYFKVKEVQNQIHEIENELARERKGAADRITKDYIAAVNWEKLARRDLEEEQKQANLTAQRLIQYNSLKREVDTNRNLSEGVLQRVKEAGVSAELKASEVRIADPGEPPHTPVKPRVALNLGLGALFGLVLGVGFAFLRESMDKTVKNPEQVRGFLSLPTLASIPSINSHNGGARSFKSGKPLGLATNGQKHPSVTLFPNRSAQTDSQAAAQAALSEAFRWLCTSMLFSTAGRPPRSILIASAQPGEGKTMVASNLAIALAELQHRVLLIDTDMRRPSLQKAFDVSSQSGLVSYLDCEQDWGSVVQATGIEGLDVLLCGGPPPNPIQLLSSKRLQTLLYEAGKQYKYVILDSPPLLNVADGRILASLVDGVMLVVKSGATPQILAQRAESYLRGVGASILGVVLNKSDFSDESYYERCSPSYYASEPRG